MALDLDEGRSIASVVRSLGIGVTSLGNWVSQVRVGRGGCFGRHLDLQPPVWFLASTQYAFARGIHLRHLGVAADGAAGERPMVRSERPPSPESQSEWPLSSRITSIGTRLARP